MMIHQSPPILQPKTVFLFWPWSNFQLIQQRGFPLFFIYLPRIMPPSSLAQFPAVDPVLDLLPAHAVARHPIGLSLLQHHRGRAASGPYVLHLSAQDLLHLERVSSRFREVGRQSPAWKRCFDQQHTKEVHFPLAFANMTGSCSTSWKHVYQAAYAEEKRRDAWKVKRQIFKLKSDVEVNQTPYSHMQLLVLRLLHPDALHIVRYCSGTFRGSRPPSMRPSSSSGTSNLSLRICTWQGEEHRWRLKVLYASHGASAIKSDLTYHYSALHIKCTLCSSRFF